MGSIYLAKQPAQKNNHWVLTPHPGEAARLLECSIRRYSKETALRRSPNVYRKNLVAFACLRVQEPLLQMETVSR